MPRARAIRAALLALLLAHTAFVGLLYTLIPPNPDHFLFDYIGWVVAEGGTLYVDAGELNWPGKMLLHTAAFALFGNEPWAYRLFDYLWMLGGCGLLYAFARLAGLRLAALLVLPLYPLVYATAGAWMTGQRDVVAAHLLLGVAVALLMRLKGGGRGWPVLAGAVLFAAVMTRPTYLLLAAFVPLALVAVRGRTRQTWTALLADGALGFAGFAGAAAIALALAWPSGALAEWYTMAVRFNLEVYGGEAKTTASILEAYGNYLLRHWHWYGAFALAGAFVLWRRERGPALALLLALGATCLGSAVAQGKGFAYHIGGLLPLLALSIAIATAEVLEWWKRSPRSVPRALTAALVLGFVAAGMAMKGWKAFRPQLELLTERRSEGELLAHYSSGVAGATMADVRAAAEYVEATTPELATVLTWGRPAAINVLAGRRAPTRFINTYMLQAARPPFALAEAWAGEVEQALGSAPPALIVVATGQGASSTAIGGDDPSPAERVVRTALETRYRFDRAFGSLEVYRLLEEGR